MGTVAVLLFLTLPAFAQTPKEALVDRCDSAASWSTNLGWEFPGADGKVSLAQDPEKGPCLRLDYDFTGGGNYVAAMRSLSIPSATAISFNIRQEGANGGFIRLADATEQEHAGGFAIQGDKWQKIVLPLDTKTFGGHWHGKDDGNWYYPLKTILIGASKGNTPKGALFIRDLAFITSDATMYYGIAMSTPDPGNVAFTGGKGVPLTVTVEDRVDESADLALTLTVDDWWGARRNMPVERLRAEPRQVIRKTVTLDASRPAYYRLTAELTRDGKPVATEKTGVVVTDKPRNFGVDDPKSFFAIQQTTDGARTERLGVKWVRSGMDWRWGEMNRGIIRTGDTEAIRRNHQLIMYNMTAYPPDWAAKLAGAEAFWEGKGNEERVALWAHFVEETTRKLAGQVDTFEIQNEPDLTCMWQEGLKFDAGVERYLKILRAGSAAIRRGAPKARVAGIDVSGGDYDSGLPFSNAIFAKAGDCIDVYSGHPYAGVRYFGDGQQPMWPVRNEERRKCLDTIAMIRRYGGQQHFWVGEKGWGLDVKTDPLSGYSRDFANCLVQSMTIAHSVPGVERYFWFLEEGCNEGGYEYGLFREGKPLPAALAYATLSRMLYHAAPFRSPDIGALIQAHCFTSDETGDGTLILWSEGDRSAMSVASMPAAWNVCDIMGKRISGGEKGGTLTVALDRSPIYVRFAAPAAGSVCAALRRAAITTADPLKLETAYIADLGHIAARLRNVTPQPVTGTLAAGAAKATITVPGGKTVTETLPAPADLLQRQGSGIPVTLTVNGVTTTFAARVDLAPCPKVTDVKLDGDLSAWEKRSGFVLDQRAQVYPPDPGIGWNSPNDLSAKAWVGWDERYLYFTARVHDKVHFAPNDDPNGFWGGDSIQIGIDALNDAGTTGGYDADDRELGLVLGPNGMKAHETVPEMKRIEVPVFGSRQGEETIYQAAWTFWASNLRPGGSSASTSSSTKTTATVEPTGWA